MAEGDKKFKIRKRRNGFAICSVSSTNLYTYTTLESIPIDKFLVGLSWFACEIVLGIFKLINCLSS